MNKSSIEAHPIAAGIGFIVASPIVAFFGLFFVWISPYAPFAAAGICIFSGATLIASGLIKQFNR